MKAEGRAALCVFLFSCQQGVRVALLRDRT